MKFIMNSNSPDEQSAEVGNKEKDISMISSLAPEPEVAMTDLSLQLGFAVLTPSQGPVQLGPRHFFIYAANIQQLSISVPVPNKVALFQARLLHQRNRRPPLHLFPAPVPEVALRGELENEGA
jgi:hypothetical protein